MGVTSVWAELPAAKGRKCKIFNDLPITASIYKPLPTEASSRH